MIGSVLNILLGIVEGVLWLFECVGGGGRFWLCVVLKGG